jgi:hypothetical protein
MWRTMLLVLALEACGDHYALHGSQFSPAPRFSGRGSLVDVPSTGDARSDVLRDGWPVWVVHHTDGTVMVLSAVAPAHTRSADTLFAGRAQLVRWLPSNRRLVAGDVLYDEYGRVLGYASDDGCVADCPRVVDPAFEERDLDRFSAVASFGHMIIDDLEPSPPGREAAQWVDWDHDVHAAHELTIGLDEVTVAPAVTVVDAMHLPLGSYTIVAASVVQSTNAPPRLCSDSPRCAACDASSPLAFGVETVSIDHAAEHAESGTILVRREPTGLAVIASSHARACTAW